MGLYNKRNRRSWIKTIKPSIHLEYKGHLIKTFSAIIRKLDNATGGWLANSKCKEHYSTNVLDWIWISLCFSNSYESKEFLWLPVSTDEWEGVVETLFLSSERHERLSDIFFFIKLKNLRKCNGSWFRIQWQPTLVTNDAYQYYGVYRINSELLKKNRDAFLSISSPNLRNANVICSEVELK